MSKKMFVLFMSMTILASVLFGCAEKNLQSDSETEEPEATYAPVSVSPSISPENDADITPEDTETETSDVNLPSSQSKAGETVFFGKYEQDNNTSNGKEDIAWKVLDVVDGKVLLITEYGLECKQYNNAFADVTWENCSLRTWLNNEFFNTAFSADEQSAIFTSTLQNENNPTYGTPGGNKTYDKVFLLSIDEAKNYFQNDADRQSKLTSYVKAQACNYDSLERTWWWLRSPGNFSTCAAKVHPEGNIVEHGYYVTETYLNTVRPVIWMQPIS